MPALAGIATVAGALALMGSAMRQDWGPQPAKLQKPILSLEKPVVERADLIGKFYQGDGTGVNLYLTLGDDGEFEFVWRGCLGEYDSNAGRWSVRGDVVVLEPEKPYDQRGFKGMDVRFVPVRWGERTYLVEENEVPGFAAAAKVGRIRHDDTHGFDYVQVDAKFEMAKVSGKPILPVRFQEFYDKGAIETKVTSVNKDGTVNLDKGSADRLKAGMLLALNGFNRGEVEVISVTENSAVAKPWYYWNSSSEDVPKPGTSYTSGSYLHRPAGSGTRRYESLPKGRQK